MTAAKPLREYLVPFLDFCEVQKGLADNTQRNYRQYLRVFFDWLKKHGHEGLTPEELNAEHIWDYRLYLARKHKTPTSAYLTKRSQNFYLVALRAFLEFLAERDIDTVASSKVKLAKHKPDETISFLDPREIESMAALPDVSKPEGLRDRAIMETFFSSGMRISELVSLDLAQLSPLRHRAKDADRTYEVPIIGKGKRPRTIFISPRAAHWLRAYLSGRKDDDKAAFINSRRKSKESRRLSPRYIQYMIAKYARTAGLAKKVTPHILRHSYATDLLSRGADLRSVQELLGHKNVATTQMYTHVTNKRLREVHEKFHGEKYFHRA
jgi:site-specific recombinase XerD